MAISELHLLSLWDDPRSRLRVLRPSTRQQLAAFSALFCSLLLLVSVRVNILQRSYDLENVRLSALQNDTKLRELKLEYAYQTQPARLRERAIKELGMRPLMPQQVRRINQGSESK